MSDCIFTGDLCVAHNRMRAYGDDCEHAFYAGFTDMMTDDQHRDARDGDVRNAISDLRRSIAWQCARIRKPTDEDRRAHDAIGKAIQLLAALPTKTREEKKRRRGR
jgi:hypothetical protein